MNITIKSAALEDAENLTAIQKQSFERLYQIYKDEANPFLRGSDEIKYHIVNGTRDIYKIFADDMLCGGVAIRNDGNGVYYLHRIYVLPQLQGKGVGKKAIKLCECNYPDAKRWAVDFPIDQIANKKCYENSGYYDTGEKEAVSNNFILAFYEKAVSGIYKIQQSQLCNAAKVIRASFATVAAEFGVTEENCPNHTSFITAEKLRNHFNQGWLMFGLYESTQLIGYVSVLNEGDGVYELHNLAVLPEYRRNGYGKQLLIFCKDKIKELGGHKIIIGIIEENAILKNWYAANGFNHTGTKQFDHLPFTVGLMEYAV